MFLAYKGLFQVDDGVLFEVFRKSTTANYLVSLHCENGDIIDTLTNDAIADGNTTPIYHALTRPSYLEAESITRAATIAHAAGASMYVVHLSSGDGLRAALEARNKGLNIYIETCPQYLLLDDTRYLEADFGGAKYVMSPPLRKPTDNEDIWSGVQKNQIEVLGTDHCAFNFKGMKERGIGDFRRIPNGAPGIETRFGLLYTYGVAQGKINLNQFVRLMSYNAAKIFGLYPQKGTLAVGSDADIVVYNPEGKYTIGVENLHEEVDYTSYEGFVQQGKIEDVFVRGQHLIHQSNLISNLPTGKFIRRNQFKPSN
jgi:dihydropyrimidinase